MRRIFLTTALIPDSVRIWLVRPGEWDKKDKVHRLPDGFKRTRQNPFSVRVAGKDIVAVLLDGVPFPRHGSKQIIEIELNSAGGK